MARQPRSKGKRRLEDTEDFVRVEIAAALERDIRVIPVLVDSVPMPRSTELPGNLKALARRNALQVNHPSFNADASRLISQLELALRAAEDSRIVKARKLEEENARREKEATEKARFEEEERKRKEAEEKARKEKDAREKAEAEKLARLATEQKTKKEREEWEQKDAEEKARKATLRKARLQETAGRIRNIFSYESGRPFLVGGGILILFLLGSLIKNSLAPSAPAPLVEATDNLALASLTVTLTDTPATLTLSPAPELTKTDIPELTSIPTTSPPENPKIGSTWVQTQDDTMMVYVPVGEFQMGSDVDEAMAECQKLRTDCLRVWFTNEEPIHTVYLDAFWIDQTEVTNAMYAKCVGTGLCNTPNITSSYVSSNYYGNAEFDDYPVVYVS